MADRKPDRVDPILAYLRELEPDRDLLAKAVAMRLRRAAHYVNSQIRRRLTPLEMDLWELELLSTLLRVGGSAPVATLQDAAQLTAGAITNRITRLERDGHVTRTIDPGDRRQIIVTLTAAGHRHAAEVIEANDHAQRATLDQIDPEILHRLADDLRTFLIAVERPRRLPPRGAAVPAQPSPADPHPERALSPRDPVPRPRAGRSADRRRAG
ncbi:MarR family winged helix-turn-helix transcriptional regulator [Dactylosporangium sp. CA-092794]|uniref:MarR family winged helix-turn-helix transcriptional regulator n=1 Tax=Dactylosporangium sp. CA-092794 TaxID=3239929 RepID=UPI003D930DB7